MKETKLKPLPESLFEELEIPLPKVKQTRTNPFTGVTHLLDPEAVQLYDFITTKKWVCGRDYTRNEWDHARYYFAQEWPNEYMDLLD